MMESRSYVFNPSQPEMKSNCDLYKEYQPDKTLQREVSLFYQFRLAENSIGTLPIIPDGCLDLLFCLDPSDSFAVIAASPEQRCSYNFKNNAEYFGVRLLPEQANLKFKCSIKELIQHQQIPLFEVLSANHSLLEELIVCPSFKERITYIRSFLNMRLPEVDYNQNLITYCLNKIYSSLGLLNIKQLSIETGYSDRYIRKKFEDYIGFSPKQFSQIVRLQHSVHELLNNPPHLDDIIDDYGFYDKAHFYKGFKKQMELTPEQYKYIFYSHPSTN